MRSLVAAHSPAATSTRVLPSRDPRPAGHHSGTGPDQDRGFPGTRATALRCLVVDDQPATLDRSVRMLRKHPAVRHVVTAADATAALLALRSGDIDVAFVEARIPDMSGVDLAWVIKRFRSAPAVVFLTRCTESAPDAFDVGALDYLCKPLQPERLAESLRRVTAARRTAGLPHRSGPADGFRAAAPAPPPALAPGTVTAPPDPTVIPDAIPDVIPDVIPVKQGTTTKLVPRSSVRWAHAQGDYVRLYTADDSYLIRARLAVLADSWRPAGLVRIHRSYLVQLRFVTAVRQQGNQLSVVVGGRQLPVSRRMAPVVRGYLLHAARVRPGPGAPRR